MPQLVIGDRYRAATRLKIARIKHLGSLSIFVPINLVGLPFGKATAMNRTYFMEAW